MTFLIDEMYVREVAASLDVRGHDALHVFDVALMGQPDESVLAVADGQDRVVVTENAVDFVPLLDQRIAAGDAVVPVVIALKAGLPRDAGAMVHALVERLDRWAEQPAPYRHAHWLPA